MTPENPVVPTNYGGIFSNWRTRLKDRYHHPYLRQCWEECFAVERMGREELLDLQQNRLNALLSHVVRYVPFYQKWAKKQGIHPGDPIRLCDLPIVDKQHYRDSPELFHSSNSDRSQLQPASSSGSTGELLQFWIHRRVQDYSYCCLARALARHGIRLGDRRGYAWGSSWLPKKRGASTRLIMARCWCRDWLNHTQSYPANRLAADDIAEVVESIERFRPVYLHGYVSVLYAIARHMLANRKLRGVRLKVVITEAEQLYPFQRRVMEEAFDCPVHENYGAREIGNIAQADAAGNLRINEDLCVIERDSNGEAIATNLLSQDYPFIRYRLGDLVDLADEAPNGLPYRSISRVVGRTVDLIPLANGKCVSGIILTGFIEYLGTGVDQFQFHQVKIDKFVLRLRMLEPLSVSLRDEITRGFESLVKDAASLEIHEVNHIEPSRSGKFRWVISDVSPFPDENAACERQEYTRLDA